MGPLSLIFPLILMAIALIVIAYFFYLVTSNINFNPRLFSERWKLRRKERLLEQADDQLEKGLVLRGCQLLRQAFCLDVVTHDVDLIERLQNHHLEILERVVAVSERTSAHLDNLPLVEGLIQSRSDLLRAYVEILQSKNTISRRRKEKGQDTPDWAVQEFSRKLKDIGDRISINRKSLDSQLNTLFASLGRSPETKEVTYH
jgi:hypothetical protein